MKLENFDRVKAIVNSIQEYEHEIKQLEQPLVTLYINSNGDSGRIMTIGAYSSAEHDFSRDAMIFIETIKKQLWNRINKLKTELSEL